MIKKLLSYFAVLSLFVMCASSTNVYASSNDANTNNDVLIQPRWWPGNPNPQPGTEDWFFQHPDYGKNATKLQAEECGKSALIGATTSLVVAGFATWLSGGVFTVALFAKTFGEGLVGTYGTCLFEKNVKL